MLVMTVVATREPEAREEAYQNATSDCCGTPKVTLRLALPTVAKGMRTTPVVTEVGDLEYNSLYCRI